MTTNQIIAVAMTVLGGLMQAGAIGWAWREHFRIWRLLRPNEPIVPWLDRVWKVTWSWVKTWWARLTHRTKSATVYAVAVPASAHTGVFGVATVSLRPQSRIA